ncbi:MAG: citrate synthase [Oscillospiraceae bacterium]|nr:citrate synthase [Oscillospiraceae bacterium]
MTCMYTEGRKELQDLCGGLTAAYRVDPANYACGTVRRGLRNADGTGVTVGVTRVGSVQGYYVRDERKVAVPGELYYRGIRVTDLIDSHRRLDVFGFEETVYLLLFGSLPDEARFSHFCRILTDARKLPDGFFEDMILKAPTRNMMNALERSVLALYCYDDRPDDISPENVLRQSVELIARFPTIVANAYAVKRHIFDDDSLTVHIPDPSLTAAEDFLRMIRHDKRYTDSEAKLLDLMLTLHAEHGGGNNSTFSCRCVTSTGTDTYSAIAAAVGSLKGPLHGGANGKVTEMLDFAKSELPSRSDEAVRGWLTKVLAGEAGDRSGKIYGLGHAVYTESDPRAVAIRKYARDMAEQTGFAADLELLETIERVGVPLLMERLGRKLPMCANVDLYSGLVYTMLGIPRELFTPLFAIARIAGWSAHRLEELISGGRIMRPAYRAEMTAAPYVPMAAR